MELKSIRFVFTLEGIFVCHQIFPARPQFLIHFFPYQSKAMRQTVYIVCDCVCVCVFMCVVYACVCVCVCVCIHMYVLGCYKLLVHKKTLYPKGHSLNSSTTPYVLVLLQTTLYNIPKLLHAHRCIVCVCALCVCVCRAVATGTVGPVSTGPLSRRG